MNGLVQYPPENVKLVDNTMYKFINEYKDSLKFNTKTKIHPEGIFEIIINNCPSDNSDFTNLMCVEFNRSFNLFESQDFIEPVSKTGIQTNIDLGIGSVRFNTCSKHLASILSHIIHSSLIAEYIKSEGSFYSVADYFRFMRYTSGGEHFPHYDSDFVFDPDHVATHSLVVYHSRCEGGELVFCKDTGSNSKERLDWTSQTTEDQITLKLSPESIKIVIFPHHLCHAVLPYLGTETRDIIRGDLIFKT